MPFRGVRARLVAGVLTSGMRITSSRSRVPCQVRSKTKSPCHYRAVVEIRGIPFCEACAREQEAYFAIGELTRKETQGLRSEPLSKTLGKTLGETLEGIRRQRTDGLAAARGLALPSVDETERLTLTKS
jgi:hypothetical protein